MKCNIMTRACSCYWQAEKKKNLLNDRILELMTKIQCVANDPSKIPYNPPPLSLELAKLDAFEKIEVYEKKIKQLNEINDWLLEAKKKIDSKYRNAIYVYYIGFIKIEKLAAAFETETHLLKKIFEKKVKQSFTQKDCDELEEIIQRINEVTIC